MCVVHAQSVWHRHPQEHKKSNISVCVCTRAPALPSQQRNPAIHYLLVKSTWWLCNQFCYTNRRLTQRGHGTYKITEKGLITSLTQTLIADAALFPADLLSLYCAKSVLLLWDKDFVCWERESEREYSQSDEIRLKNILTSLSFYLTLLFLPHSFVLTSPFISVTLRSPTLTHPQQLYL